MAWLGLGIVSFCFLFWLCKRTDMTAKEPSKSISFSPPPATSALSMLKAFDAEAVELSAKNSA
jgi:hypothetical protein